MAAAAIEPLAGSRRIIQRLLALFYQAEGMADCRETGHCVGPPPHFGMAGKAQFDRVLFKQGELFSSMRLMAVEAHAACHRGMDILFGKRRLVVTTVAKVRRSTCQELFVVRLVGGMTARAHPYTDRSMNSFAGEFLLVMAVIAEIGKLGLQQFCVLRRMGVMTDSTTHLDRCVDYLLFESHLVVAAETEFGLLGRESLRYLVSYFVGHIRSIDCAVAYRAAHLDRRVDYLIFRQRLVAHDAVRGCCVGVSLHHNHKDHRQAYDD